MERPYEHTHLDLVQACLAGNRKAQFELYGLYSRALFNTILRMVNDRQEAEDLLQAAFVDIFTKMDTFRFESSIGAWMKRVTINKAINHLKAKRLQFVELVSDERIQVAEVPETSAENEWVNLSVEAINRAMKALPEGYRTIFSLYAIEGYDHEEIGQILGITESTSKSQYSRAKAKIREMIG